MTNLRRSRILIVEDERHIARLFDHVLRKEGYDVTSAHDAEQARELMRESVPDAVLLDLVLPGMSGLDLLRELRSDPRLASLVVIVLSGHWFGQDDPTLASAGATAQCSKPIAPSKLVRKLQECAVEPWTAQAPAEQPRG